MTSKPSNFCHTVESATGTLKIMISISINITITPGRGPINSPPPPTLYDGWGVDYLLRPRVKQKEKRKKNRNQTQQKVWMLFFLRSFVNHVFPDITDFLIFFFSECQNYQNLTGADRNVNHSRVGWSVCDSKVGPGWFRFTGAAGTKMVTSCPPTDRCQASVTGWLTGGHPTVHDGQVTKRVCFHWRLGCCTWSTYIQVRNCGSFFVYYFDGTPTCNLRYCGTD